MFTPRGYTALPQDAAPHDEDDVVENINDDENVSKSFQKRKKWLASKGAGETTSTPRTSRESEEGETSSKERRVKRNVRFKSRSIDERPEAMSNARRLCFVASLMICTLTIFVFAFTVPCKGPSCNVANMITTVTSNMEKFHRNWSSTFTSYSTGIVFHLSSIKTREIVVSYRGKWTNGKDFPLKAHRSGVKEKGESSMQKDSGLISLDEYSGKLLWLYNKSDVIKLIECRTDDNSFETCLIQSSRGRLQLINPKRNQIFWSARILIGSLLPSVIIGVSDCDGDDGRDILLSYDRFNTSCMPSTNKTACVHPGIVLLISGRTGYPLGSILNIPPSHLIKRVSLHSTRQAENLIFVLTVGNKGHLKVMSIQDLYRKVLENSGGESSYLFGNSTVSMSDIVSTEHEPVVKDLNKDFVEDIILVTLAGSKHSLTALDGGKLKKMWRIAFGSRKMLSQPVIGHFNDDEIPDILVILGDPVLSTSNQSLVQILDGENGNVMWSRRLRLAKNTTPLSASVGYKSDVFLLWVERETVNKYQKIFPSNLAKDFELLIPANHETKEVEAEQTLRKSSLFYSQNTVNKNSSDTTWQHQEAKHRRSPRSVESREKMTSPVGNIKAQLDSFVDEVFVKDYKHAPTVHATESSLKTRLKPKNKHQLLEDILKQEPAIEIKKEGHSHQVLKGSRSTKSRAQRPTKGMNQTFGQVKSIGRNIHAKPWPTAILNIPYLRPTLHDIHDFDYQRSGNIKNKQVSKINSAEGERIPSPGSTVQSRQIHTSLTTKNLTVHHHAHPKTKTRGKPTDALNDKIVKKGIYERKAVTKKQSTLSPQQKRVHPYNVGGDVQDRTTLSVQNVRHQQRGEKLDEDTSQGVDQTSNAKNENGDVEGKHGRVMLDKEVSNADRDNGVHNLNTSFPVGKTFNRLNKIHGVRQKHGRIMLDKDVGNADGDKEIHNTFTTLPVKLNAQKSIHTVKQTQSTTVTDKETTDVKSNIKSNDGRRKAIFSLPVEQTLDRGNKVRNITKNRDIDMVKTKGIESNANMSKNTSPPDSHSGIPSQSTAKIVNSRKSEDFIVLNSLRGSTNHTGSSKNGLKTATVVVATMHPELLEDGFKMIGNNALAVNSENHANVDQGSLSTTRNISKVLSPTTCTTGQVKKKIVHDTIAIGKYNVQSPDENSTSDIHSLPGRVSTHHPRFFIPQTTAKIPKTSKSLLRVSLPRNLGDNGSTFAVKEMENLPSENLQDIIRDGESIIVMPKKIPKPVIGPLRPRKYHSRIEGKTAIKQRENAETNTSKRHIDIHTPAHTNVENSSNDSKKNVTVHFLKDRVNATATSPDSQYHRQTFSDTGLASRPQIRKTNYPTPDNASNVALSNVSIGVKRGSVVNIRSKLFGGFDALKLNKSRHLSDKKSAKQSENKSHDQVMQNDTTQLSKSLANHEAKLGNTHHDSKQSLVARSKEKHNVECREGFDLALMAIIPGSAGNSFTVISQENVVRRKKKGLSAFSCENTLWPSLSSNPLVHDADSDGFLEVVYAVNYDDYSQTRGTMKVRKLSVKVESED